MRVYDKLHRGVWAFAGVFRLVDAWQEQANGRGVFKFKLELTESESAAGSDPELQHARMIPTAVKLEVWKRDRGQCVECGSTDNLHFDHVIPFSRGGSSSSRAMSSSFALGTT